MHREILPSQMRLKYELALRRGCPFCVGLNSTWALHLPLGHAFLGHAFLGHAFLGHAFLGHAFLGPHVLPLLLPLLLDVLLLDVLFLADLIVLPIPDWGDLRWLDLMRRIKSTDADPLMLRLLAAQDLRRTWGSRLMTACRRPDLDLFFGKPLWF